MPVGNDDKKIFFFFSNTDRSTHQQQQQQSHPNAQKRGSRGTTFIPSFDDNYNAYIPSKSFEKNARARASRDKRKKSRRCGDSPRWGSTSDCYYIHRRRRRQYWLELSAVASDSPPTRKQASRREREREGEGGGLSKIWPRERERRKQRSFKLTSCVRFALSTLLLSFSNPVI